MAGDPRGEEKQPHDVSARYEIAQPDVRNGILLGPMAPASEELKKLNLEEKLQRQVETESAKYGKEARVIALLNKDTQAVDSLYLGYIGTYDQNTQKWIDSRQQRENSDKPQIFVTASINAATRSLRPEDATLPLNNSSGLKSSMSDSGAIGFMREVAHLPQKNRIPEPEFKLPPEVRAQLPPNFPLSAPNRQRISHVTDALDEKQLLKRLEEDRQELGGGNISLPGNVAPLIEQHFKDNPKARVINVYHENKLKMVVLGEENDSPRRDVVLTQTLRFDPFIEPLQAKSRIEPDQETPVAKTLEDMTLPADLAQHRTPPMTKTQFNEYLTKNKIDLSPDISTLMERVGLNSSERVVVFYNDAKTPKLIALGSEAEGDSKTVTLTKIVRTEPFIKKLEDSPLTQPFTLKRGHFSKGDSLMGFPNRILPGEHLGSEPLPQVMPGQPLPPPEKEPGTPLTKSAASNTPALAAADAVNLTGVLWTGRQPTTIVHPAKEKSPGGTKLV